MNQFHGSKFEVNAEGEEEKARVVKQEEPFSASVRSFSAPDFHQQTHRSYPDVKARFGALAATDPDRSAKSQKDRRFSLNELARGPLSVEEEERNVIEEQVRTRIATLSDEVRQKGFQAGYADGAKEGHAEAFEQFQKDAASRIQGFDQLLGELEAAKEDVFRANERFLIELVFRVSRMVVLQELKTDPQYVLRLTRDLIERVGVRENIRIRVNPKDKETIGMIKDNLDQIFGGLKNVNIEASSQVAGGGCLLDTEWNAIDASIETQLRGVYEALIGQDALTQSTIQSKKSSDGMGA